MAISLDKTINQTIPQKLKLLIFGKEKPNFLTRVSVTAGFVVWLYLFSWYLLTFMSLILMNGIKPGWRTTVIGSFQRVGSKLYGYPDSINMLFSHAVIQIAVYAIILFALLLIWRKKKLGFIIFVGGYACTLLFTLFFMGPDYLLHEVTKLDFILIGVNILYFGIGAMWFYKWKHPKKDQEIEEAENV